MRLLFITSRLPYPPNRGDRLRVFNFIRNISQKHEISLISFISKTLENQHIPILNKYCHDIQTLLMTDKQSIIAVCLNLWRRMPLQALYYRSSAMQKLIDNTIDENKFDAVYIHLFRMAPYFAGRNDLFRIVDLTDVISSELVQSMPYRGALSKILYKIEKPRIKRYESWVANHFDETWLISEHDRTVLTEDCPNRNIQIVRNGVDTNTFYPTGETPKPNSLIMVGHMSVFHNVDAVKFFVHDIMPIVLNEIPKAQLNIVGTAPNQQVQALASHPNVNVTGYVADLNDALNQSIVFVAPLRFCAGVQNKILEAMAAGRPVVTTPRVNQGLGAKDGRDLLTRNTPEEIANAILRLLHDKSLCEKIGVAARKFVKKHYRWDFVDERLESIQDKITNHRSI